MMSDIAGLILAGGLARRMGGGDKALLEVEGQSLLDRVIERLAPQVGPMILNANGDPNRFAAFTMPVVPDVVQGYAGPLAGILTGLEWLEDHAVPEVQWMVSVAADTPLFPLDLVERLKAAIDAENADIAVACGEDQPHPVFALWPRRLGPALRDALVTEDMRKIDLWTARFKVARVSWPTRPVDPFFNVNTPEDVVRLRLILSGRFPAEPPVSASAPVAAIIERRPGTTQWVSESWLPVEILAEPPAALPAWSLMRQMDSGAQWLAGGLTLTLHRSDLAAYRYNLASEEPRLYVVLRRTEESDQPVKAVLVTAAPDEAQGMSESGEDMVDGVPMPTSLRDWIEMFCACHPPDEPMRKRKRQP